MKRFLLLSITSLLFLKSFTQVQPPVVSVLVPLYLDSMFTPEKTYKHKNLIPKIAIPGMEYYFGVNEALDSLQKIGVRAEVNIYDYKSQGSLLNQLPSLPKFKSSNIILGSLAVEDVKTVADYAKLTKTPFLSVTYPNDANVVNNPFLTILNPTLKANCERIYEYLQKTYSTRKIYFLTKEGKTESRISDYFTDFVKTKSGVPLVFQTIDFGTSFDAEKFKATVDSTIYSVCIVASTDKEFALATIGNIATANLSETTVVMGMPTWSTLDDLEKPEYNNVQVYYPYAGYVSNQSFAKTLNAKFTRKYGSRASDNVMRGFLSTFNYIRLYTKHQAAIMDSLNDATFNKVQPYFITPTLNKSMTVDYFENKNIPIIKKINGAVVDVY
jgi:hypothetical protein